MDLTRPQAFHLITRDEQLIQLAFGFDAAIFEHDDVVSAAQRCPAGTIWSS